MISNVSLMGSVAFVIMMMHGSCDVNTKAKSGPCFIAYSGKVSQPQDGLPLYGKTKYTTALVIVPNVLSF